MKHSSLTRLLILIPFYIVAGIILFIPLGHGPSSLFSPFDWLIHEGLFALLGIVTLFVYSAHTRIVIWSLVIVAAYSEIIQSLIPTRTTDTRDLFNDSIGILIALCVVTIIKYLTSTKTIAATQPTLTIRKQRTKKYS